MASELQSTPGFIDGNAIYTLAEFQARLRLKRAAMRQARRSGLRVRRFGRQGFVLGRDAIAWLEGQKEDAK